MKIFIFCSLIAFISCAHLQKRQNINNLDNIQELLKELEKANINVNQIGNSVNRDINNVRNDTPVRDALTKLFGAFQQMASAYVGVLTSVGKSMGIPTIPIGGVQFMQASVDAPIGIKQIAENLRQFQHSVQEVTKTLTNMVTRDGPAANRVVLEEMQKFMRLWSHQVQEVADQVNRAFGGLESDISDANQRTIPQSLKDLFNNLTSIFGGLESDVNGVNNVNDANQKTIPQPIKDLFNNWTTIFGGLESDANGVNDVNVVNDANQRTIPQSLKDLFNNLTSIFGGLESDVKERTIPESLKELMSNVIAIFDDTVDKISLRLLKMIAPENPPNGQQPGPAPGPNVRDNLKPELSDADIIREFKILLENIQKRVKSLSKQLDELVVSSPNTDKLEAEHREETKLY